MSTPYDDIRTSVISSGTDSRVEVNQRALIDKILARYASAGAVYRELLQNSNDAEASTAEIRFTTSDAPSGPLVTQVVYRNNGLPFRPQDWARLRKIAEGNPDVSKVGAFGVGAYTMFSICEEPLVISASEALAFAWKGDALWTKTGPSPHPPDQWTTFVLPSRDPYRVPNLVEFGQFLCASLTFTQCLHTINLFVDDKERLTISKNQLRGPTVMTPPKASSWWSNDGAVTHSPMRIFSLGRADGSITETIIEMTVALDGDIASITARYVSALANVRVPHDMAKKMYRVTKKKPPTEVNIQIFVDATAKRVNQKRSPAAAITGAFSPGMGKGSIFIGFKTSQTTGLAAHLAAPLVPTVEREAIDFQDPSLMVFNSELLSIAGVLMRLTLEHSMILIGKRWEDTKKERMALEQKLKSSNGAAKDSANQTLLRENQRLGEKTEPEKPKARSGLFGFASFMSSGVKRIAEVISSVDLRGNDDENLLNPEDPRPLSGEEEDAIMLMLSFCPEQSTPDPQVGSLIANGFVSCMPNLSPPVLTNTGIVRSSESRLPFRGIERFVTEGVIRKVVQQSAEPYLLHVAGCPFLGLSDLERALRKQPLSEDDLVIFLKWWTKFCRVDTEAIKHGPGIKTKISFRAKDVRQNNANGNQDGTTSLETIRYYRDESMFPGKLPMPATLIPQSLHEKVTQRVLADKALSSWFSPLPFNVWASFICRHACLTDGRKVDFDVRLLALSVLSKEHSSRTGQSLGVYERWLKESLSSIRCIPFHSYVQGPLDTDFPGDLYLSSAELAVFEGLGSFRKVSPALQRAGISDDFLVVLGVRKAISIDFLFTQLDNLKWSGDPKPLISYLRTATLTEQDMGKLRSTRYLPASNDKSTAYAPPELHLPNLELATFPFVKTLHWPTADELSERSQEGRFLKQLGCRVDPDLKTILDHLTNEKIDETTRLKMLSFISQRLRPGGPYEREYGSVSSSVSSAPSAFLHMKFLPVIRKDPLQTQAPRKELQCPLHCYIEADVLCMGFSVLDPLLQKREGKAAGERFLCKSKPVPQQLVYQLLNVISFAKPKLARHDESGGDVVNVALASFKSIFDYLSTRANEFDKETMQTLRQAPFIPCQKGDRLEWYRPTELYFQNANSDTAELTVTLYPVIEFNPFLAAVGVESSPSLKDLFELLLSSPSLVLNKLGESKYRALLRRVAANPPYAKVTAKMRKSSFLLAYRVDGDSQRSTLTDNGENDSEIREHVLARAEDISVIDNSFFARMFNVLSAPPESDLESFYESIGSQYISKRVQKRFEWIGQRLQKTSLTADFMTRIQERKPLLVSPSFTARKLKPNAAALLEETHMEIYEVGGVKAIYSLDNLTRTQDVTCFASIPPNRKCSVYLVSGFDWFDVGSAIGNLILKRCRLEDSFFIGSLLEAPLKQLRARGFPVDRILEGTKPAVQAVEMQKDRYPEGISNQKQEGGNPNRPRELQHAATPSDGSDGDGFVSILTQMFPDCDQKHIQALLGTAPTLDTLRQVADSLADGSYPKQDSAEQRLQQPRSPTTSPSTPSSQEPFHDASQKKRHVEKHKDKSVQQGGRLNSFSRALRGIKSSSTGLFPPGRPGSQNQSGRMGRVHQVDDSKPVSSFQDAATQKGLESMLRGSIRSSRKVSPSGVSSQETLLTSVPEGVQLSGEGCEVIPAQNLKPFLGRDGTGKTRNGIRVFSSRRDNDSASELYLDNNLNIVEAFSTVLHDLCVVYALRYDSVAIFHEASGRTIAFNAGSALHFNVRFFAALHWRKGKLDAKCYSYWFTTMAHELAHNFVAPHNKEHGYFTESFVTLFLPELLEVLR